MSQNKSKNALNNNQLDFFVITAKNRIMEQLQNMKNYQIQQENGFLIQRYIPQRGSEPQVYRAHWNNDRGLKCYLYSSSQQYNGKEESQLNFERLANLYRDVSLLGESEIRTKLQQKAGEMKNKKVLTPRSQKHLFLQKELLSRFPRLNTQFRLNMKAQGEKPSRSPERFVQTDNYSRQKLKFDTKRSDFQNTGGTTAPTYRKVIMSIQRQVNEIIQSIKNDPALRQLIFGDANAQLKKLAIDFIEDYNSTMEEPSLMLIRLYQIEGSVVIPPEVQPSPSPLPIIPKRFKCNGDYCQIHRSPFIPTHLAPIVTEMMRSSFQNSRVSISIIEDDRRLLKQLLMTNENEMRQQHQQPFVDQMIDLRGVQLLSKSQEVLQSNLQRERNAASNKGSSIAMNPFIANNLQTQHPSIPNTQAETDAVEVCNICFRVYSYLQSLAQPVAEFKNQNTSDATRTLKSSQSIIHIYDQQNLKNSLIEYRQQQTDVLTNKAGGAGGDHQSRSSVVVRFATEATDRINGDENQGLYIPSHFQNNLHAKKLRIIAEDPASIVTQTAEAADRPQSYHDMSEVTKGNRYSLSKTSDDMAQLQQRADGIDNLNIVTFQLADILPGKSEEPSSPGKNIILSPKQMGKMEELTMIQKLSEIPILNSSEAIDHNPLLSQRQKGLKQLSSQTLLQGEQQKEIDTQSIQSAYLPRKPPRPMFFYGNQNLESSQKSKELQDSQNELSDNQSTFTLRSRGGGKISRRGSIVEEQNRRVDKSDKKMVIVDEKNNDQECDIIMLDSLKKNQLARTSSMLVEEPASSQSGKESALMEKQFMVHTNQFNQKIQSKSTVYNKDAAIGLVDILGDPNITKDSNIQEEQEGGEINVDIKQGIHTERNSRKASIQKRRSILIDDNDFQTKVDSFFGQVSNQDEEYLMEYVVGNNGSGGSQDGKDDSADEEEKEEEENLSPRITALLMQNEDIKIGSQLKTSNNNNKSPDQQKKKQAFKKPAPADFQKLSVKNICCI